MSSEHTGDNTTPYHIHCRPPRGIARHATDTFAGLSGLTGCYSTAYPTTKSAGVTRDQSSGRARRARAQKPWEEKPTGGRARHWCAIAIEISSKH